MNKKELKELRNAIKNMRSEEHTFYISGDAFSCRWNGGAFLWTAPSGSVYKMDAKEVIKSIGEGRYIKRICYDFN